MLDRAGTIPQDVPAAKQLGSVGKMTNELPGAFQDTMRLGLPCEIHLVMVHDLLEQCCIEGTARLLRVEDLCTEDAIVFCASCAAFEDIGGLRLSCHTMPGNGFAGGSAQHMAPASPHGVIRPDHQFLLGLLLEQVHISDRPVSLAWKDWDPELLHHI